MVNLGTQERVRLSHVKHATCVRVIEVSLRIHVLFCLGFMAFQDDFTIEMIINER